jgi:hypothetical protein
MQDMAYWWDDLDGERYWVEIRRVLGIGISLYAPTTDENGDDNPWYELVHSVRAGDVIYHYNARESRFVGRSVAAANAVEDTAENAYTVELRDFEPIVAPIGLADIRASADKLYAIRDRLESRHGHPLYLPFQYTQDRSQIRMMSNYFVRLPREMVELFFGSDGLGNDRITALPPVPGEEPLDGGNPEPPSGPQGFLDPFKPKADTDYAVGIVGGRSTRTRAQESLVNTCAMWLARNGREPGRNAAIDLGTEDPPCVIEAKAVGASWPTAVRQAVGQLYEYRYFKVSRPDAGLVFLASKPVPAQWVRYLEKDRGIGVMWPTRASSYELSSLARRALKL